MAGGQRTETTREEAPWLRSPNPKTGIAPRVPALLGHPQAEAPRSSPPGFSPFAPDRSCLQADRGHVPGCRADADADASTRSGFGGDGDGGGKRIPGHNLRASPALTQQRRTLRAQAGLPWQTQGKDRMPAGPPPASMISSSLPVSRLRCPGLRLLFKTSV